MNQGCNKVLQ